MQRYQKAFFGSLACLFLLTSCNRSAKLRATIKGANPLPPTSIASPSQIFVPDPTPGPGPQQRPLPLPGPLPLPIFPPVISLASTVFAIGRDNQVHWQAANNPPGDESHPENYYQRIGMGGVKQITLGYLVDGTPAVFAIGMDDQVYWQRADNLPSADNLYRPLAPGRVKQVTYAVLPNGAPALYVIRLDDSQVYCRPASPLVGTPLTPDFDYLKVGAGTVKQITVGVPTNGELTVFAIGLDDQVYRQSALNPPGEESTQFYRRVGSGGVKRLALAYPGQHPTIFAIGMDDLVYRQSALNPPGDPHSSDLYYQYVGGGTVQQIDLGYLGDELTIYGIGLDGQVYRRTARIDLSIPFVRVGSGAVLDLVVR